MNINMVFFSLPRRKGRRCVTVTNWSWKKQKSEPPKQKHCNSEGDIVIIPPRDSTNPKHHLKRATFPLTPPPPQQSLSRGSSSCSVLSVLSLNLLGFRYWILLLLSSSADSASSGDCSSFLSDFLRNGSEAKREEQRNPEGLGRLESHFADASEDKRTYSH